MREQLGIITKQDKHCFDTGAVGRLCEYYVNTGAMSSPDRMFVVIDPCGGGASALAVVSGFMNNNMLVVRPIISEGAGIRWAARPYCTYARKTASMNASNGVSDSPCAPE